MTAWFEREATATDSVRFVIYVKETRGAIGTTTLFDLDYRNRAASFGILIGEADCRAKGYGTEATRLLLDYAFTALGLHSCSSRPTASTSLGSAPTGRPASASAAAAAKRSCWPASSTTRSTWTAWRASSAARCSDGYLRQTRPDPQAARPIHQPHSRGAAEKGLTVKYSRASKQYVRTLQDVSA